MTMRFSDSFDHYETADISLKWTSVGGVSPTIAASGRNGTNGMRFANLMGSSVSKTLDNQQTWIIGFSINAAAFPVADAPLVQVVDAGVTQVTLSLASDGKLKAYRGEGWSGGANSVLLGTSSSGISAGVETYIEFKVIIDNTIGEVSIRIAASSVLSLTGQDTQVTANAFASVITLGEDSGAVVLQIDIDDLVIMDGVGALNSNFLGDVRVEALFPNGVGNYAQWTPQGSGINYQNVDETPDDDDTTYNVEGTTGDKDSFAFQNVSISSGTIKALVTHMMARKDDAGVRQIRRFARIGGTDYAGSSVTVASSYSYHSEVLETNPATASLFTIAEANAAEFGVEVVS